MHSDTPVETDTWILLSGYGHCSKESISMSIKMQRSWTHIAGIQISRDGYGR